MSRNSDKANTVLFRYQEQQAAANGYIDYNSTQRPRSVQRVTVLKDAEGWRKQVLQEISQKVLKINDETLSDYQIRDLNDEINKLMREKLAWEHHIKALGGPDYIRSANGKVAGGVLIRGYRYFGRAKDLPGVKEILKRQDDDKSAEVQKREQNKSQQQRLRELEARVGLEYYGYYDEVSGIDRDVELSTVEHARGILGDLVQFDDADDADQNRLQSDTLDDKLLKFERSATKKRTKRLIQEKTDLSRGVLLIDDAPPPTLLEVEAHLVERRKRQLETELGA